MTACRCIPEGLPDSDSGYCCKCGKHSALDPAQAERDRVKAATAMHQRRMLDNRIARDLEGERNGSGMRVSAAPGETMGT